MNRALFVSFAVALLASAGCRKIVENLPPVAVATGPDTVDAQTWVQLDGSGSSDPEGASLNRHWDFVQLPLASDATLNDPGVENPSFYADVPGDYVVQLVVDDGYLRSDPATVTVTARPVNQPPVADAGLDRNVVTGSDVLLDGSGSSDPDGDTITYGWSFVQKPSGSTAAFDDATSETPTFHADIDGEYHVRLVVNDGQLDSQPAFVVIDASADNLAPIADAGVDQSVAVGTEVTLDGSGSHDPNGSALTFTWSLTDRPTGSSAAITQDGTASASFTPDIAGDYSVALVVSDGTTSSAPDVMHVQAYTEDHPPVANAGASDSATTGQPYQLDGSASYDPDGDLITYDWTFVQLPPGSHATLNNAHVVRPSFVPDVDTTTGNEYVLRLDVWDGVFWSQPQPAAFVTITSSGANRPPVAVAQLSANTPPVTGTTLVLDGSGSYDPDANPITYQWTFVKVPAGFTEGLNNDTIINPSFTATVDGYYDIQLTVNDGQVSSAPVDVTFTTTGGNQPPVANAGPDQAVDVGTVVSLDGSGSYDLDMQPDAGDTGDTGITDTGDTGESLELTYHWAFTSKPAGSHATLNDPSLVKPSFVADVANPNGDDVYVLSLVVSDGSLASAPDTVVITAGNADLPPIADAGTYPGYVDVGVPVTLSGNSYDQDVQPDPGDTADTGTMDTGDTGESQELTYQWAFVSLPTGSHAQLNDPTLSNPSFTPDVNGAYTVRLIVSDGILASAPSYATINAHNGNTAPTVVSVTFDPANPMAGDTVQVTGTAQDDQSAPQTLTWDWSFNALPAGSTAVLNNASISNPSFVADKAGDYTLRVRVSDGQLWSDYHYYPLHVTTAP